MTEFSQEGRPPRFAEWLLNTFCSHDFVGMALWDMEELYFINLEKKGQIKASLIYYKQVFGIIYHLYFKGKSQYSYNNIAMLKNNFILALRGFKKDKSYGILNLIGLGTALVVLLLTGHYAAYELGYDSHYPAHENIYRIYKSVNTIDDLDYRDAGTPAPLAEAMLKDFPEVESATRFMSYRNVLIETEQGRFIEPLVLPADPGVLEVFGLELIGGTPKDFLGAPMTMAISRSLAMKYFNRTNVVGESMTFWGETEVQISAVFEDQPVKSHFSMDAFVHFESMMAANNQNITRWNNNPFRTYVRLAEGTDAAAFEAKLPQVRARYANDPLDEDGQMYTYFLQPMKDVHFNQKIEGGIGRPVDISRIYLYLIIAVVIMVIACINYVNLATARSLVSMKAMGVRKVAGARRYNLIFQFLMESAVLVFTSIIAALFAANALLPAFGRFVGRDLTMEWANPYFWIIILLAGLLLTLLSGIYPALLAASVKPVSAMRGIGVAGQKGSSFRNVLVTFQFTISTALIVGALVLQGQLNYIDNIDTGYSRDNVVVLSTRDDKIDDNLDVYMESLSKISGIEAVATSWSLPTNVTSNTQADWTGITDAERLPMYMVGVTHDFFRLFDVKLSAGRFFDKDIPEDSRAMILNETAVKKLGWEEPLGREMITQQGKKCRVIGVVKDFHIKSLKEEIAPLQILLNGNYATLSVKVSGPLDETLVEIESLYESFEPDYPFQYRMFEDIYARAYTDDTQTAQLTLSLTVLTIIIACLGLYGLVAHKVQQRVKELGVRKVLGASTTQLMRWLARDFFKLLLPAFLIASPAAWFVMQAWLDDFVYRIDLSPVFFLIALGAMLLIIAFTVGYRTYQAVTQSPVLALRDE